MIPLLLSIPLPNCRFVELIVEEINEENIIDPRIITTKTLQSELDRVKNSCLLTYKQSLELFVNFEN